MKKLIIFICNGNIHRSVIAAECLRSIFKQQKINSKFSVDSYGLQGTKGTDKPKHQHLSEYSKEWAAAKPSLNKFSINISDHSFQKITPQKVKEASVIIAMDNKVYNKAQNSLIKQFPKYIKKIHRFSELAKDNKIIPDPAGSGDKKLHQKVIKSIYVTLDKKYKDILDWIK